MTYPDFDAVRDKRMSEMTPAQREDALEFWIRNNIGWYPGLHKEHVDFLLARLDAERKLLAWVEPILAPVDSDEHLADPRTLAVARQLMTGKSGRPALEAAMAADAG